MKYKEMQTAIKWWGAIFDLRFFNRQSKKRVEQTTPATLAR